MILGSGLLQSSWPRASDYLIRDEFTDTVAAGSVNGTAATPGPGTRVVVDTDNLLAVGGGTAALSAGKTDGNPGLWYGSIASMNGLAMLVKSKANLAGTTYYVGWDSNTLGSPNGGASITYRSTNKIQRASLQADIGDFSATSWVESAIVFTGSKHLLIVKIFGTWTILYIESGLTAGGYPSVVDATAPFSVDYLRVLPLPAPFDTDDGLATDSKAGSVAAGTTFTHEADALIEYTLTTRPSADNADVLFRVQDASNYWVCRVNSSGDISLVEVVAGTPTTRGTAAGVVSSGHRVVIIADGTTVRLYSNNTLRVTYASASSGATATAGEVDALGTGGVVSNVKMWPRTLSGTAASILNKASA